ncbi:hypothetical protein GN244_ATG01695 [Phytophthora infestans]|uniref:MULE transposase domain-containing protein n=1 Tax=Phytophthora infestans TaxID=4787 RepID=A0A833TME0_PHYIN|nr:hypothetical protein GN244_ATG01695 [Phytophthora infestans]
MDYNKTTELFLLDLVSVREKQVNHLLSDRTHHTCTSHKVGASSGHGAERLHTSPPQASISITTIYSTTSEGYNQPPSTQSQPALRVKKKCGSKTIEIYKGFKYTKSWASTKNIVYRCINGSLRNETGAMKKMTDCLAAEDPGIPEEAIWERICSTFYGPNREELIEGLTEEQVKTRVRQVRRRYYGGDIHGVVEVPPCSKVKDSAILFFRFHLVTAHPEPNAPPNRILGWAYPIFYFTTVFLFLLTTETMYEDILHLIHRDTGQKLSPAEVVCDFEFSLLSAVQSQCPNAEVKERLTEDEILIAVEPGVLDILTVIDPELVDPKGIGWVKQEIKRKCADQGCVYSAQEWRRFWLYFRKTWLERYFITEWNVFGIMNSVVTRTNNPLERFNREMKAALKPHPNLRQFVSTIGRMSSAYARKQASITRCLRRKKQWLPRIALPPVPDLTELEVPPESDSNDAGFE